MNSKILAAKALGFTNSISKLTTEERGRTPRKSLGEDYNKLLNHVINLIPDLSDYLPPKATFFNDGYGTDFCNEPYAELFTYCEQLYQMLNSIE